MTINDGEVIGRAQRILTTPFAPNASILLLAEGYLPTDLGPGNPFALHCAQLVAHITHQPWYSPDLRLNIYSQDVSSTHQGADVAAGCNLPPVTASTYFDAIYGDGGICRVLSGDETTVDYEATKIAGITLGQNAAFDAVIVLVNSAIYGGSSSGNIVWAPARLPSFPDIALHELGHFVGLHDEYGYRSNCRDKNKQWNGLNFAHANVDYSPDDPKWIAAVTQPLPTLLHPGRPACETCYDPPDAVLAPYGIEIGTFEGSGWFHCGLYRPTAHCKMRKLQDPFCKICEGELVAWLS